MKTFFALLIFGIMPATYAQRPIQNHFSLEFGGQCGLFSVNYERIFKKNIGIRTGYSNYSLNIVTENTITAIPLMLNHFVGEGSHKLEVGIGCVWITSNDELEGKSKYVNLSVTAAYRYVNPNNGFIFRFGFAPSFGREVLPLPVIGIGLGI